MLMLWHNLECSTVKITFLFRDRPFPAPLFRTPLRSKSSSALLIYDRNLTFSSVLKHP
jgi:hypothetical protein